MKDWKNALLNYNRINDKLEEVGFEHPYDFTKEKFDMLDDQIEKFLNQLEIRKMLHVGKVPFTNSQLVYEYLKDDTLQTVKPMVEELLSCYKMLFYAGQFDMVVTRAKMNKFARTLKWIDAIQFAKQQPINWYVDGDIAGYIQSVSNLTEVLVRSANHMTAASQPLHIFCLLRLFVDGGPFDETTLDMNSND